MPTDFEYTDERSCDLERKLSLAELREWGLTDRVQKLSTVDELEEWYQKAHAVEPMKVVFESRPAEDGLSVLFSALSEQWKLETWHISSIRKTISHEAYLKIIGMGKDALPFIFEDMRKEKSLWFWALEAITRQNILPDTKSTDELHEAWLDWATRHGY